jgi:hypothetical protein
MSRRTGYRDKNGKPIREGNVLEGYFTAPWDDQWPIKRQFRVVKQNGRWFCEGIESGDEDDWLKNFKHLEVKERSMGYTLYDVPVRDHLVKTKEI